ncbi:MAG TPA: single-stranded DNA-binding protein [Candidatus Binataceae bacterium]|jgi:single-strand DNA-binding protein|nr:single-stranded DNA-binding protein [Candidatus Binataceae bacterium]
MSLNKVMVIGRLGRDPEMRYTPNGLPVGNFAVATYEPYVDNDSKRHERTEWHRVVVIGKLALSCSEFLKKGRQVYVEGRLRTREFESRAGAHKQRRTEIVATRVQFLGTPPPRTNAALEEDDLVLSANTEGSL